MRYLLLSSCFYVFIGCASIHQQMPLINKDISQLQKFKPVFNASLYYTTVNVVGNHLSGLLLIKKMPDSSTRLVFSNEMGFKFFDFEFALDGSFKVYAVIKQLNKKAVLKTLRKDFELILMENLKGEEASVRSANGLIYYVIPKTRGFNYYITDSTGDKLVRLERASKSKTIVSATMEHYNIGVPDTIGIVHQTFHFIIGLKRIER
jgi:hypothetical protein